MMRLLGRAALVLVATGAILSGPILSDRAHAATDPAATIRNFYATLLQTMKEGPQLGEAGRYNALAPAIRQDFDLSGMAQMAVGPHWATLSPAERQQVTEAFARYTIATYADHFGKYDGERLDVRGAQPMPYGTIVDTQIGQPGAPANVNYLMRQNGGAWKISDIYLNGTISQVANLRSQFSAVILRGGAQELVATLNQKTASLVPNLAAS